MAQPLAAGELGSWRGEGVRLGQVVDALAELRRREQRTATRASVTNLVLVASSDDDVATACTAVHRLGRRHPGRSIVLLPEPGAAPDGIDAEVLLHGTVAEGRAVWSEDVRLEVRGRPARHLRSLVEPLTLADLPVALWYVSALPGPEEALLGSASTVVVDSERSGVDGLATIVRLGRRNLVHDLCWIRLRPWRQLLAGLFDLPGCRRFLYGIHQVDVPGEGAPGRLLGGWLVSRLGIPPSRVTLQPRAHPLLRVNCEAGGDRASFVVALEEDGGRPGGVLRASATVDGVELRPEGLSLPEHPLAWSLGEALSLGGRDRAHGQALHSALVFVR